jgi:hypothetical protein
MARPSRLGSGFRRFFKAASSSASVRDRIWSSSAFSETDGGNQTDMSADPGKPAGNGFRYLVPPTLLCLLQPFFDVRPRRASDKILRGDSVAATEVKAGSVELQAQNFREEAAPAIITGSNDGPVRQIRDAAL